jgi:hypothetical protein
MFLFLKFINNQRPNERGQSGRDAVEAIYCTDKISFSFHNVIICQFPFLNGALCLSESNDSAKHKFKQILSDVLEFKTTIL